MSTPEIIPWPEPVPHTMYSQVNPLVKLDYERARAEAAIGRLSMAIAVLNDIAADVTCDDYDRDRCIKALASIGELKGEI